MAQLNEVQVDPQTGIREVTTYNVPDCFASILDKKINNVALNCLEQFVDWILSNLYTAYDSLWTLKSVMRYFDRDIHETETVSILRFPDGTPVYDLSPEQNLIAIENEAETSHLTLRVEGIARRVLFSQDPHQQPDFSRETTQYLAFDRCGAGRYNFQQRHREFIDPFAWLVNTALPSQIRLNDQEETIFSANKIPSVVGSVELRIVKPERPGFTIYDATKEAKISARRSIVPDAVKQYSLKINDKCVEFEDKPLQLSGPLITIRDYKDLKNPEHQFLIQQSENEEWIVYSTKPKKGLFGPKQNWDCFRKIKT